MFNYGDYVFSETYGYGIVVGANSGMYEVVVFFNKRHENLHDFFGRYSGNHIRTYYTCHEENITRVEDATNVFFCNICGSTHNVSFNGKYFACSECLDKPIVCQHCGETMSYRDFILTHDYIYGAKEPVCRSCFYHHYDRCRNCRMRFDYHEDEVQYSGQLCPDCRQYERTCSSCGGTFIDREGIGVCERCTIECGGCGYLIINENYTMVGDLPYCDTCFEELKENASMVLDNPPEHYCHPEGIVEYSYKPYRTFVYPDRSHASEVLMGIELEVDGGASHGHADEVNDILGYTYVKQDGSLDDGMEIVTFPATPEFHYDTKRDEWKDVFAYLKRNGLRSHDAGTCGLHIHVSSVPLAAYNCDAVEKLMFLWDKHWDNMLKFSRRTPSQCNRWAARYSMHGIDTSSESAMALSSKKLRMMASGDRYRAINLENPNTVEFRMFRGTLNPTTFFATIQFLQHLINQCVKHTFSELREMSWYDLVDSDYPDLNQYLETRGLKNPPSEEVADETSAESGSIAIEEGADECCDNTIATPTDTGQYTVSMYNNEEGQSIVEVESQTLNPCGIRREIFELLNGGM